MWKTLARRRVSILGFLGGTALVYAVALVAVNSAQFRQGPALPFAVTCDLVLTVPVFYYVVLVRRAGFPAVSMVPVFLVCLLGAGAVLPEDSRGFLEMAQVAGAAAEVFLLGFVVHRAGRAARTLTRGNGDPLLGIRQLLGKHLGNHRLTEIVTTEAAVLYYAFLSWRSRTLGDGARRFSYHRECGWGSLLGVLGFFAVMEIVFVHLLLSRWSPAAAWAATLLGIYGAIWVLGDYRAMILRPIRVLPETVRVSIGLRWQVEIPRTEIARVWRPSTLDPVPPRYMNAAILGDATVMIELEQEATARGLFGMRKRFRVLGLSVDEAGAFVSLLADSDAHVGERPEWDG
jgi:hypothetical protein